MGSKDLSTNKSLSPVIMMSGGGGKRRGEYPIAVAAAAYGLGERFGMNDLSALFETLPERFGVEVDAKLLFELLS
jgi:hypothetical protein